MRGLGDLVAKGAKALGFEQKPGCGCAKRQETLNRWVPFQRQGSIFAPTRNIITRRAALPAISGGVGGEEAICSDPNVFMCDNFEDRPLGNPGVGISFPAISTPSGKSPRWDVDSANAWNIVSTEPGVAGGGKTLQIHYPACMFDGSGQDGNHCSGGSGDWAFSSMGLASKSEFYFRTYLKWSPTWVWSEIFTKIHALEVARPGRRPWLYTDPFGGHAWLEDELNNDGGLVSTTDQGNVTSGHFSQNQGNDATFNLNQWYCVEIHVFRNVSTNAGLMEMWIDDVLRLRYSGIHGAVDWNSNWTDVLIDGFWNTPTHTGSKPATDRWYDNVVASVARIGCVGGTPPPPPPPPPAPPTITITSPTSSSSLITTASPL